jgi:hypothetical protein
VAAQAQTEAEVVAARNAKMDESLGQFDEVIRNEREQIARERDAQAQAAGGEGAGDANGDGSGNADSGNADGTGSGSEQSGGSAGEEKTGEKKPGEEARDSGDMKSDRQAGGGTGGTTGQGQGPAAQNIPDGSDDDIIARQIREAAEKETDPELKEKLWKEYIEYKKNAQKK